MSIIETVSGYLRDRRALEELRRLDDRLLADIGLRGVDLRTAVKSRERTGGRTNGAESR